MNCFRKAVNYLLVVRNANGKYSTFSVFVWRYKWMENTSCFIITCKEEDREGQ